jgi:pantothenate kinase
VIIEGLYTLLDVPPWKEAVELLDERIWVDVGREVARQRLVARHLHTGVETEKGAAERRGAFAYILLSSNCSSR